MRKIVIIIFLTLLFLSNLEAKDRPLTSVGDIKFYLDYAGFKGLNGKTIQEFYIQVFADQFTLSEHDTDNKSQVEVSVKIEDNFGKQYFSKFWILEIEIPNNQKLSNTLVVHDQWAVNLGSGQYRLMVELNDKNNGNTGQINSQFTTIGYTENSLEMSEIEFVTNPDREGNIQFKKGNLFIKPNPWRRYGILNPILYLYYELYNTQKYSSDSLGISYVILDESEKIIKEIVHKKDNPTNDITILNGINVTSIPTGIYTLKIKLSDYQGNRTYSRSQDFEIIQPDFLSSSDNSDEVIEISLRIASYLMTVNQLDRLESLKKKDRIKYLFQFWKENDPTPISDENEYLNNMIQRYNYAQKKFTWSSIEGWKTDKGRILIKYGMPDDIERYLFEENSLPYEKWTYHSDREFDFIFCDLRSDGRYTLLHSTREEEIHNPDWFSQVKQ